MKTKYIDMKCPYCKIKMFRIEGSFADWSCNKCGKLFRGGTIVKEIPPQVSGDEQEVHPNKAFGFGGVKK